jgi:hypothetical protein
MRVSQSQASVTTRDRSTTWGRATTWGRTTSWTRRPMTTWGR